jgi:hypothetical protein
MSETEYTKGYRAGRAYEQDRIVKLLETQLKKAELEISLSNVDLPKLVALIEGEHDE